MSPFCAVHTCNKGNKHPCEKPGALPTGKQALLTTPSGRLPSPHLQPSGISRVESRVNLCAPESPGNAGEVLQVVPGGHLLPGSVEKGNQPAAPQRRPSSSPPQCGEVGWLLTLVGTWTCLAASFGASVYLVGAALCSRLVSLRQCDRGAEAARSPPGLRNPSLATPRTVLQSGQFSFAFNSTCLSGPG